MLLGKCDMLGAGRGNKNRRSGQSEKAPSLWEQVPSLWERVRQPVFWSVNSLLNELREMEILTYSN